MNNKGFTLVELIATILLLALVMSIGTYSVVTLIRDSKEKNYEMLISNVKDAVETYRIECKYNEGSCNTTLTLGWLVSNGYLSGNSKDEDVYALVNPMDNKPIGDCEISYSYATATGITIVANNQTGSCPTSY